MRHKSLARALISHIAHPATPLMFHYCSLLGEILKAGHQPLKITKPKSLQDNDLTPGRSGQECNIDTPSYGLLTYEKQLCWNILVFRDEGSFCS